MGKHLTDKESGLTLAELLVVVSIVGVVALMAYPNVMEMVYRMESKRVESVIHEALRSARNESHIRRRNIIVCPASKQNVCDKTAKEKMIVFVDLNNNHRLDVGELIQVYELNLKHGRLDMRVSLSRNYIKYFGGSATPRGHFGHIKYCSMSSKQELSYRVVLTHQGRVYRREGGC